MLINTISVTTQLFCFKQNQILTTNSFFKKELYIRITLWQPIELLNAKSLKLLSISIKIDKDSYYIYDRNLDENASARISNSHLKLIRKKMNNRNYEMIDMFSE